MRSFNANFVIEKNRRADGPCPINLITFFFSTPVYISDRDVTPPGGAAHAGLVKSWGFLDSSVSKSPGAGILGSIDIADLKLTIINTQEPRFSDNFSSADPPENVTVELYQWFDGLQNNEKELIFKGVIAGQPKYDEYLCTLTIKTIWEKYNGMIADEVITAEEYPSADPDNIGKSKNICYGRLVNVPCRAVESGAVDNIIYLIDNIQTTIELSDASEFPVSGMVQIDDEQISYTSVASNTLSGCIRGYNGTTANTHTSGVACWEIVERFVYQVAGHPVNAINNMYVDGRRITPVATGYTGGLGDELAGYEGQAVFTVPTRLTRQQVVDLGISDGIAILDDISIDDGITVSDGITISDGIAILDDISVDDGITVSDDIGITVPGSSKEIYPDSASGDGSNLESAYDGNEGSYASVGDANFSEIAYWGFPSTSYGTITLQYFWIRILTAGDVSVYAYDGTSYLLGSLNGVAEGWYRFSTTETAWDLELRIITDSGEYATVYEIKKTVEYTASGDKSGSASKTGTVTKIGAATKSGTVDRLGAVTKSGTVDRLGAVTKSGTVALTGNSVADVEIGKLVTCDFDGYQDDDLGTYTGVPNALIEQPDHVIKHICIELLGIPSTDIDTTSFAEAGIFFATWSYTFALVVSSPIRADTLLTKLALQCRSRFFVTPAGKVKLFWMRLGQSSGHAIAENEIRMDSMAVQRSAVKDLINNFNIHYDLDYSKNSNAVESFRAVKNFFDSESITKYGKKNYAGNILNFDAVTKDAMAQHVGEFLLAWHARVKRMPEFAVFLDNLEIEPGDIIDVTHTLDTMNAFPCEVIKIKHVLGSGKKNIIDRIEVTAIENS